MRSAHRCPTCGLPPLNPSLIDVLVDGELRLGVLRDDDRRKWCVAGDLSVR